MKKLLGAFLAAAMVFTMGIAVFAEEPNPADASDQTKSALSGGGSKMDAKQRDMSQYALSATDTVTVNGNQYVVDNGNVRMELNLDPSLGMLIFTRDFAASIQTYFLFEDPEALWQAICDTGANIYAISTYTGAEYLLDSFEKDGFTERFGTLSTMSEEMQKAYLTVFAQCIEANTSEVFKAGNNVFYRVDDAFFFTFVGGNMIRVINVGGEPMSAEDLEDIRDYLACFSFTAH